MRWTARFRAGTQLSRGLGRRRKRRTSHPRDRSGPQIGTTEMSLSGMGAVSGVRLTSRAIRQKITRLATGGIPQVLDLFSGRGVFPFGLSRCRIRHHCGGGIHTARSHGMNFHAGHPALASDVIVGGPPCEAFARVRRSNSGVRGTDIANLSVMICAPGVSSSSKSCWPVSQMPGLPHHR
jgi:hypothetical protein